MSLESRCDERLATAGRTHRGNYHEVIEVLEWVLVILTIIPAALVHELSQDFNRWLGTVLLDFWHVQIIHENDTAFREGGTKDSSPSLLERAFNDVLHLVAVSLGRVADKIGFEMVSMQTV